MVNVLVNDVVNVRASCLSLSMSACRQRWIFLRIGFARCARPAHVIISIVFLVYIIESLYLL